MFIIVLSTQLWRVGHLIEIAGVIIAAKTKCLDRRTLPVVIALSFLFVVFHKPQISGVSDGLLIASALTNLLANLTLTERFGDKPWYFGFVYNAFFLLTYLFIKTDDILTFFIIYELFLLPSAALVWRFSPGERGTEACKYFLLWTQTGSIMVFLGVVYLLAKMGVHSFTMVGVHGGRVPVAVQLSIMVGFLIKVPSFPFFFWLLKTHVESVTSFSILLSGFLVKIALYGLYKFYFIFNTHVKLFAVALLLVGGMASSSAFFRQTDYKKLVAYATIQEMSQLATTLLLIGPANEKIIGVFIVVHSLLSAIFFFISDILYRIYNSRSTYTISGLMVISPKLSALLVASLLLFKGLPFTAKNKVEVNILSILLDFNKQLTTIWLIFILVIGNLGITYITLKLLVFAPPKHLGFKEVTYFELLFITFCLTMLLFFFNL